MQNEQNQQNEYETVFGLSPEQYEEIRKEAREKVLRINHTWRQKGFWLICKTCDHQHATWLGKDKVMIGEDDDGNPIIEDLK